MSHNFTHGPVSKHVAQQLVCLKNTSKPIVLGPSKCFIVTGVVIAGINQHSYVKRSMAASISLSRPSFVGAAHIIFNSLSNVLPIGLS